MKRRVGSITVVAVGAANTNIAAVARDRMLLAFGCATANGVVVNNRALTAVGDGFPVFPQAGLIELRYEDFGELIRGPWFGFGLAAAQSLAVIEVYEVDDG